MYIQVDQWIQSNTARSKLPLFNTKIASKAGWLIYDITHFYSISFEEFFIENTMKCSNILKASWIYDMLYTSAAAYIGIFEGNVWRKYWKGICEGNVWREYLKRIFFFKMKILKEYWKENQIIVKNHSQIDTKNFAQLLNIEWFFLSYFHFYFGHIIQK